MKTIQKKICLLGQFAVGKTSLMRQFVEGRFEDKYLSTIGVKISRRQLFYADHRLNLIIWDLAGGDDYVDKSSGYLRGAAGALIVCDLTRENTLDGLEKYAGQLREFKADTPIVCVGNKLDLVNEREISDQHLSSLARHLEAPYIYSSAKTGEGVEEAFKLLAEQII